MDQDQKELRALMDEMRRRVTALEFILQDTLEPEEYSIALIFSTNNILDCALDLSKVSARVERANKTNSRNQILKGS